MWLDGSGNGGCAGVRAGCDCLKLVSFAYAAPRCGGGGLGMFHFSQQPDWE
jgi:hypothetical protein